MAFTRDFKLYETGAFYDCRTDSEDLDEEERAGLIKERMKESAVRRERTVRSAVSRRTGRIR